MTSATEIQAPMAAKAASGSAATVAIFKRELRGYFETPVAYVFLVAFVFLSAFLAFRANFSGAPGSNSGVFTQNRVVAVVGDMKGGKMLTGFTTSASINDSGTSRNTMLVSTAPGSTGSPRSASRVARSLALS